MVFISYICLFLAISTSVQCTEKNVAHDSHLHFTHDLWTLNKWRPVMVLIVW